MMTTLHLSRYQKSIVLTVKACWWGVEKLRSLRVSFSILARKSAQALPSSRVCSYRTKSLKPIRMPKTVLNFPNKPAGLVLSGSGSGSGGKSLGNTMQHHTASLTTTTMSFSF
ncbi:hypothetical protein RIF29_23739 [Crotalaria pallida]|uniref:Uncharacterized protein n=1 Tax=Crotalaria pallida TaxID=3830 RepID=A0AAN9F614_CROPI